MGQETVSFSLERTQTMKCELDYSEENLEFQNQCIRKKKRECLEFGRFQWFSVLFSLFKYLEELKPDGRRSRKQDSVEEHDIMAWQNTLPEKEV